MLSFGDLFTIVHHAIPPEAWYLTIMPFVFHFTPLSSSTRWAILYEKNSACLWKELLLPIERKRSGWRPEVVMPLPLTLISVLSQSLLISVSFSLRALSFTNLHQPLESRHYISYWDSYNNWFRNFQRIRHWERSVSWYETNRIEKWP